MSSTPRRVVITGIGLISPYGNTKEALWEGLTERRSAVSPLSLPLPPDARARFAGEAHQFTGKIDDFGPLEKQQKKAIRKGLKVMCRETQMGVAAAQLALSDAGIAPGSHDPMRSGVIFGTDYMLSLPDEFNEAIASCLDEEGQFEFDRWGSEGLPKMSPLWLLKYLPNMPASHLAIYNDFRGPSNSLTLREAAANLAIWEAFEVLRRGHADVMLAGATGTRIHTMKLIHAMQQDELADPDVQPERACRPFDRGRTGEVLGEGAAVLVLEDADAAERRGATVYGEVVGGASSAVIEPLMRPHRDRAMANALRMVLQHTGRKPEEIGHLHAHGLSTQQSDIDEARAIRNALGDAADAIPVTAAKGHFGNLGAASGAVELIASTLALREGYVPPLLNYEEPDPDCPINAVTDGSTPAGRRFVNLNVTPQGQASALMVEAWG